MQVDAMIVGAQKAGTTALVRYLGRIPQVNVHDTLEFPFFSLDEHYEKGIDVAFERWFPDSTGDVTVAKNVGVMFLPWARERLHRHNPSCHVIMCVRDPVSRAHSAFWYLRTTGQEKLPTFEAALAAEPDRLKDLRRNHHFAYVARGRYHEQATALAELFGSDHVHLVQSSDLQADPTGIVRQLVTSIGMDAAAVGDLPAEIHNPAAASRSQLVARIQRDQNIRLPRLARQATSRLPKVRKAAGRLLARANRQGSFVTPEMAPETRVSLEDTFAHQNSLLAQDFGVDTSKW